MALAILLVICCIICVPAFGREVAQMIELAVRDVERYGAHSYAAMGVALSAFGLLGRSAYLMIKHQAKVIRLRLYR